MSTPPGPRPRLSRLLFATVSGFAIILVAAGYGFARDQARIHGWSAAGLDWLIHDEWARTLRWKAGAGSALLLFGALLLAESKSGRWSRGFRLLRPVTTILGHPAVTLLLLLLAFALPSTVARMTQPTPPEGSPNLLFLLIDTWRADHAGFLGYERDVSPNLDALVETGVVFERAIAPAGWTKPSVATLLTGLTPSRHLAVSVPQMNAATRGIRLPAPATTWVEILRARGWDTAMWSPNPNITPHLGFAQGAAHFVDYFNRPDRSREHMPGRLDRELVDVRRWLREERDADRPFCAYVHVMDPHYPFEAPAPFAGTFDHSGLDFNLDGPTCDGYRDGTRDLADVTPEMVQRLIDAYDEELLFTDHHLGALLAEVFDEHPNTIVVLVGDHGEEFLEHGGFGHASTIYEELVHVPLVIWAPDLAPARIGTQVPLMDVFPTLLDLFGLEEHLSPLVQGTSLRDVLDGREREHRLAPLETGGDQRPLWHWRGLSDGRHKMVRREKDLPSARPVPSLGEWDQLLARPTWFYYDLTSDPGEQRNLFPEGGEEAARALFATLEEKGWYLPPEAVLRLYAEHAEIGSTLEDLQRLGYASASEIDED